MSYLYAYYTIVSLFVGLLGYSAYQTSGWKPRLLLGATAIFAASTAAQLGLLHSWTGEGFGYFASVLRALGVPI
jgi:hypothetical protein